LERVTGQCLFELFNRGKSERDLSIDDGVDGKAGLLGPACQGFCRPLIPVRVFGEDIQDVVT
jgi:hypothetical protein